MNGTVHIQKDESTWKQEKLHDSCSNLEHEVLTPHFPALFVVFIILFMLQLSVSWRGIFCGNSCFAGVERQGSGWMDRRDQWALDRLIVLFNRKKYAAGKISGLFTTWLCCLIKKKCSAGQFLFDWRLLSRLFCCCSVQFTMYNLQLRIWFVWSF